MTGRDVTRRRALRLAAAGIAATSGCLGLGRSPSIESETAAPDGTATPTVTDRCNVDPAIEGDDPLLVEFDAAEKYRCAGQLLDGLEHLDRWENPVGTLRADTERYVTGSQSAHLSASKSEKRASMHRTFPDGIDLSDRNVSMAINVDDTSEEYGVYFQLYAPNEQNRIDMWQDVGSSGWVRLDFGPTKVVGNPNLTDVRQIGVTTWAGEKRRGFSVDSIRTTPRADQGYVVLTFDDGLATHYTEAYQAMQEFDFPGVAGVMPDSLGNDGFMTLKQVRELDDAGWDIVSHPQEAKPLPTHSPAKQEQLLRESKQWLVDEGFEKGARFIIWPYSAAGKHTRDIGSRYHYLGFGDGGPATGPPFTGPMTVSRVNGDEVERTKRMIRLAAEYNHVAIPMFHPITTEGDRITPKQFRDLMQFIADIDVEVVSASTLWDDVVGGG